MHGERVLIIPKDNLLGVEGQSVSGLEDFSEGSQMSDVEQKSQNG